MASDLWARVFATLDEERNRPDASESAAAHSMRQEGSLVITDAERQLCGPPNATLVRIHGNVNGKVIGVHLAAQGDCTIEQFKKVVYERTGVKTGTYYFTVKKGAPPGQEGEQMFAGLDERVVNLPQVNGAIHLTPVANGK